jgi:hypothetical protein
MSYNVNTAGSQALYSVRWVNLAYTGPIFTIRRSSDNATSNFYTNQLGNSIGTNLGGTGTTLASWLGVATAFITTWYDQSTNGKHATQTTPANQPTYNTTSNCLVFDGTSQHLVMPNGTMPISNTSYTITIEHGTITTGIGVRYFLYAGNSLGSATTLTTLQYSNAGVYNNAWGGSSYAFGSIGSGDKVVTIKYDGSNRYGYVNGTSSSAVTASGHAGSDLNNLIGYGNAASSYLHLFSFKTPILLGKKIRKKCKINSRNFTYDGLTFSSSLFLLEDVKDEI